MPVLPDRLATLSPAKRALLLQKLQANNAKQTTALTIPRADRTQDLPLSFSQQWLWFLSQFEGSQSAYNIPMAMRWDGQLQETALLRSFQTIVERHEVLRTHFVVKQGSAIQVIADRLTLPLERLDWRSLPADQLESALAEKIQQEAQRRFDLQQGALFQVVLIQTSPTTQYPGVREAAILVREDVPGSKLLCAYVVAQPGEAIEVAGLRQALRQQLPDYMVPSFILLLDMLPLTANGKVDRKALPKPEAVTADRSAIALPQTQLERQIAQIWAQHLQIEAIGLHDNFFDLGGHSLLMVKIHSELQTLVGSELKTELNIVDLFQFPTIATLVGHLQHQKTKVSATEQAQQRTQVRTAQVQTLQQATAQHRRSLRQQFRTSPEDD